jgi:hypothetical protein
VQRWACVALENMMHHSVANVQHAADADGVKAVVRALVRVRAKTTRAETARAACGALLNMMDINAPNCAAAVRTGAVAAVCGAMRGHAKHAGLQDRGCWCLEGMVTNVPTQDDAAKRGAVSIVLAALRTHVQLRTLQECACGALASLTDGHARNQREAASQDGMVALAAALTAAVKPACKAAAAAANAVIAAKACTALLNVLQSASKAQKAAARDAGTQTALLAATQLLGSGADGKHARDALALLTADVKPE